MDLKYRDLEDSLEYKKLLRNVEELNSIQNDLLLCIENQGESLERIEENISNIDNTVETAKTDLQQAESYFFKYTPILLGTAIGTATMGPVGAILNLKLPSLFFFGGGIIGGMAGYKIQKI